MRALSLLVLLVAATAWGQTPITPKAGSPLRKAILDAMRAPVEKSLKQKVIFQVDHLKVQGDWAFMSGKPLTPKGGKIDYSKTEYKDALEAGAFDDWACALLKKKKNKWTVVEYAIGATDVVWDGWDKLHKAPRTIFPYGN